MTEEIRQQSWGPGVQDWDDVQVPLHLPLYRAVLDALALPPGSALLDAGCGTGPLSRLASELAMIVTGLDASENSIAFARTHGANATFVVGDLQRLPFETGSFDGVAGCNSYQFAADPGGAVRDAARVLCSRGRIALAVFDLPEKCDAYRPIRSIYSLLPQSRETLPPFALSGQNALATLIGKNGFAVEKTNAVDAPWTYRDLETALRAFMSAGPSYQAREAAGEERLRVVLEASLSPYRQPDASYRLENVFIVVVAQKMGEMN